MRRAVGRLDRNVPGAWYTTGGCLACGAPEHEAPELLAPLDDGNSLTFFVRQPTTRSEQEHACAAAAHCCVNAVRYGGRDRSIIRALGNSPECSDHVIGWLGILKRVAVQVPATG